MNSSFNLSNNKYIKKKFGILSITLSKLQNKYQGMVLRDVSYKGLCYIQNISCNFCSHKLHFMMSYIEGIKKETLLIWHKCFYKFVLIFLVDLNTYSAMQQHTGRWEERWSAHTQHGCTINLSKFCHVISSQRHGSRLTAHPAVSHANLKMWSGLLPVGMTASLWSTGADHVRKAVFRAANRSDV